MSTDAKLAGYIHISIGALHGLCRVHHRDSAGIPIVRLPWAAAQWTRHLARAARPGLGVKADLVKVLATCRTTPDN